MAGPETEFPRSGCLIANTLDLVGDRWSLVIVRDMINGRKRYGEFPESPERITTSVLADRLGRMEASGLVEKATYRANPPRCEYSLTRQGRALPPVLQAMCRRANEFVPGAWATPSAFLASAP